MKKVIVASVIAFMFGFGVSSGQAATVELKKIDLTPLDGYTIEANLEGSMDFGIYLTDKGELPNVDMFNFQLLVSGASGLEMPKASVKGPTLPDYIFFENSFAFTAANPGGDLSQIAAMDVTSNGIGNSQANDKLLAMITFNWPALPMGTILSFSLNEDQSFIQSDENSGTVFEGLMLVGNTQVVVPTPVPGAVWLLGFAAAGLLGLRRKSLKS